MRRKNVSVAAVSGLVGAALALFAAPLLPASATADKPYENLKIFTDVLTIVSRNYVEPPESKQLVYGAIEGMLGTLDPHSSFMPPDVYQELKVETKGSFGGLGIEITVANGVLTVVSPIEDTPAYKAGVQAGDQIVKIDGQHTKDMTLYDAVKKMRGPKDSPITITIWREGFEEAQDFTIVRDDIRIQSVKSRVLEPGFGYVRITTFQEKTADDLVKALNGMEDAAPGLKGLVIDLRNNPGGLLDQAVKVSDEFLDSGLVVYTDGRIESQRMRFQAKPDARSRGYPIVVLVNGGSASASEIVAGALQDHKRAVILGRPTFGKGSVQTIIPLDDGSGLRLTTARYYTPSGRSIQAKGIEPDILDGPDHLVTKSGKVIKRLRERDLKGHFEDREEPAAEGADAEPGAAEEDVEPLADGSPGPEKKEKPDPQVERALQILKSWQIFSQTFKAKG